VNLETRKHDLRREMRLETRKKVHDKIFTRKSRKSIFAFLDREVHHNFKIDFIQKSIKINRTGGFRLFEETKIKFLTFCNGTKSPGN
jgi:hypothetical protein